MTRTQFSPIMQRAAADLHKELHDSLTLILLAGDRISYERNLELLVSTAMKVVTAACAETAQQIFATLHEEMNQKEDIH